MNLSSFIIPKFEFFFSLLSSTPGQIVYWLFVFCVTVAFAAILIEFETSFNTLSNRAKMNIVLRSWRSCVRWNASVVCLDVSLEKYLL